MVRTITTCDCCGATPSLGNAVRELGIFAAHPSNAALLGNQLHVCDKCKTTFGERTGLALILEALESYVEIKRMS